MKDMLLLAQTAGVESISYGWLFARMLAAMIIIIVLAFLTIRYLLPKLVKLRRKTDSVIEILDFQALDQRRSIYLVKIEDKQVAVGVTDHGVTRLCEWDLDDHGNKIK